MKPHQPVALFYTQPNTLTFYQPYDDWCDALNEGEEWDASQAVCYVRWRVSLITSSDSRVIRAQLRPVISYMAAHCTAGDTGMYVDEIVAKFGFSQITAAGLAADVDALRTGGTPPTPPAAPAAVAQPVAADNTEGVPAAHAQPATDASAIVAQPAQPITDDTEDSPASGFNRTDLGNARRFVRDHGENIRWAGEIDLWLNWNSRTWEQDRSGAVARMSYATIADMHREADNNQDKALGKHAHKSESKRSLDSMIAIARTLPGMYVAMGEVDAQGWLLNVSNGSINLQTGALRQHSRDDLMTKLLNLPYDPAATCPRWEQFMSDVMGGNMELVSYLQKAVGSTLTGDTTEQIFFFLYGDGSNGKSTFINVLTQLMAGHTAHINSRLVLERDGIERDPNAPSPALMALHGSRFVVSSEIPGGRYLDEALVKDITGGDTITARGAYKSQFDFKPVCKLWLYGNHKPRIKETKNGIWRRVRLIPFTQSFPDGVKDTKLGDKLLSELPGILAWAVRGCLAWQAEGMKTPAAVLNAVESYREEEDRLGDFLREMCVTGDGCKIGIVALHRLYSEYSETAKVKAQHIMERKAFNAELVSRGHRNTTGGQRSSDGFHWIGLGTRQTWPNLEYVSPAAAARPAAAQPAVKPAQPAAFTVVSRPAQPAQDVLDPTADIYTPSFDDDGTEAQPANESLFALMARYGRIVGRPYMGAETVEDVQAAIARASHEARTRTTAAD